MMRRTAAAGLLVSFGMLVPLTTAQVAQAQTPAALPASMSTLRAKELVAALQGRKLEAFAVTDPSGAGRYVAVLHIPGVQLLVVSASYERATDMDYRFYHKDFMNVYLDLRTGVLSKDRMFIEDAGGDGLVAVPGKNPSHDSVTVGTAQQTFDGDFSDPKKKNQKKINQDDYMKKFTEADEQYTRILGLLVEGLKKG
jgi:hypothetical protein